jgi:hypothetical protein
MAAVACDYQKEKLRLARRLSPVRPAMTPAEATETMRIHRVAGGTGHCTAFMTVYPASV